jgi:hypothetical protein
MIAVIWPPLGCATALYFRWSNGKCLSIVSVEPRSKKGLQPDDPNYLKEDLIKFLERNHFSVVVTDEEVNYTSIIRATTASCHLQIGTLTPDGSNRDLIRDIAAGHIARSSSFVAWCTSNSQFYGQC